MKALLAIVLLGSSFAMMAEEVQCPVEPTYMMVEPEVPISSIELINREELVKPKVNERFTRVETGDVVVTHQGFQIGVYYAGYIVKVNLVRLYADE